MGKSERSPGRGDYQDAKVLGHLLREVTKQRVLDIANAPILPVGAGPCQVGVLAVDRHANDLGAESLDDDTV